MRVEQTILKNILKNHEYSRKVLPFLKEEYFKNDAEKLLFAEISSFATKYNDLPTTESLLVELDQTRGITEDQRSEVEELIKAIERDKIDSDSQWLIDKTESFCQESAIHNAILQSINIYEGSTKQDIGMIPELLKNALAISFDPHIGHDYFGDWLERYNMYHERTEKFPFDLELMNKITRGGVERKSLNVILAGTGVGKTMFMCHMAAAYLKQGFNVLYITMEMAEQKIAKRVEANMFNVDMNDIENIPREMYEKKISKLRSKTDGNLVVHEYPTASAGALHFKALMNELQLKKDFKPDIVFVDYINICSSSRYKQVNDSYGFVKAIAEELRGLAVEFDLPVWTATQVNRQGFVSSDPGLENTSESFGLPATADFMFALVSSDTLKSLNQIMVKQLKNRYEDPDLLSRFVLGVDKPKMKFYDPEASAQTLVTKIMSESGNTGNNVPQSTKEMVEKFKKLKVS